MMWNGTQRSIFTALAFLTSTACGNQAAMANDRLSERSDVVFFQCVLTPPEEDEKRIVMRFILQQQEGSLKTFDQKLADQHANYENPGVYIERKPINRAEIIDGDGRISGGPYLFTSWTPLLSQVEIMRGGEIIHYISLDKMTITGENGDGFCSEMPRSEGRYW